MDPFPSLWLASLPIFLIGSQQIVTRNSTVHSDQLEAAVRLVEKEVASGAVGAAALLVARNGVVAVERGFGRLSRDPGSKPCESQSIFLVASISKPVTATAVMRLVDQGRIRLDDPARNYLPEFTGDGRERITIRNLLSHTSGLPDMLPENIELRKRQAPLKEFVSLTLRTPLLFPPASRVSYQSMGILLAAEIVERMTGKPLDAFLQKEVFAPLKMRHSSMGIGHRNIAETVQCDLPSSGDLRMSASDQTWNWNSSYWRKLGVPWGGMHSTVGDIYRLLQAMLDHGSRVLKPELAQAMITDQNKGLNRPWGLGWEVGKEVFFEGSPAKAFGHRGATGTLCWADPDRKLVFVLFTNRPLDNDKDKFLERVAKLVSDAVPGESQDSDG